MERPDGKPGGTGGITHTPQRVVQMESLAKMKYRLSFRHFNRRNWVIGGHTIWNDLPRQALEDKRKEPISETFNAHFFWKRAVLDTSQPPTTPPLEDMKLAFHRVEEVAPEKLSHSYLNLFRLY